MRIRLWWTFYSYRIYWIGKWFEISFQCVCKNVKILIMYSKKYLVYLIESAIFPISPILPVRRFSARRIWRKTWWPQSCGIWNRGSLNCSLEKTNHHLEILIILVFLSVGYAKLKHQRLNFLVSLQFP